MISHVGKINNTLSVQHTHGLVQDFLWLNDPIIRSILFILHFCESQIVHLVHDYHAVQAGNVNK